MHLIECKIFFWFKSYVWIFAAICTSIQPNMNHLLVKSYLPRSLASLEESSEMLYIEPKPLKN